MKKITSVCILFLFSNYLIAQNIAPIVNDIDVTAYQGQSTVINLANASTDLEGSDLTFLIETNSENASLDLNSSTGEVTYTATLNFSGNDTFTYKAFDGVDYSVSATVTINVIGLPNSAPLSSDASLTTNENNPVQLNLNTISDDLNGDSLIFNIVTDPQNGDAIVTNEGLLTYTPNGGFSGTDTISFRPNDGELNGNVAEITIIVNETPNSAPVANAASITTEQNSSVDFLISGFDSNFDLLTLTITDQTPNGGTLTYDNSTAPTFDSGTTTFTASYTPASDYMGTETVSFSVSDGSETSSAAITFLVTKKTNSQPQLVNKRVKIGYNSVNVDLGISIIDPDGDTLSVSEYPTTLENGSVSFSTTDQIFRFTPNNKFVGTDFFTFKSSDTSLTSPLSTIYIDVIGLADINGDKNVDTIDLVSIASNIVGLEGYEIPETFNNVYDVNQDGNIDTIDLVHLASFLVGVEGYNINLK